MVDPEQWNRPDWIMQIFMWSTVAGTICLVVGLIIGLQF